MAMQHWKVGTAANALGTRNSMLLAAAKTWITLRKAETVACPIQRDNYLCVILRFRCLPLSCHQSLLFNAVTFGWQLPLTYPVK